MNVHGHDRSLDMHPSLLLMEENCAKKAPDGIPRLSNSSYQIPTAGILRTFAMVRAKKCVLFRSMHTVRDQFICAAAEQSAGEMPEHKWIDQFMLASALQPLHTLVAAVILSQHPEQLWFSSLPLLWGERCCNPQSSPPMCTDESGCSCHSLTRIDRRKEHGCDAAAA
eukprot:COSAG02_NODE_53_length_44062_cov_22.860223_20_plen_168_part_00